MHKHISVKDLSNISFFKSKHATITYIHIFRLRESMFAYSYAITQYRIYFYLRGLFTSHSITLQCWQQIAKGSRLREFSISSHLDVWGLTYLMQWKMKYVCSEHQAPSYKIRLGFPRSPLSIVVLFHICCSRLSLILLDALSEIDGARGAFKRAQNILTSFTFQRFLPLNPTLDIYLFSELILIILSVVDL